MQFIDLKSQQKEIREKIDLRMKKILDHGKSIRLSPGVVGARANMYLASYNRRIGPDPASINAARIGGIVSNNSSGMVCGVKHNTFHTMKNIRFILANGHTYDTSNKNDYERFIRDEESLSNGLLACKKELTGIVNIASNKSISK